jgi:nitrate reductase NapAB chaperone NapD
LIIEQQVSRNENRFMPVSGYVIRCAPEDQCGVREQLKRIPGIEIGEATDTGIPVATEAETSKAAETIGEQLQNLKGVKSAVLVYHNFEDVTGESSTPLKNG